MSQPNMTKQQLDYGVSAHKLPFKTPFFYGWMIVVIGALGVFFSGPGQTYSVSVFIDAYIVDFGWDRTLVSSIYSGATLLAGFLLFFIGKLVDQFGQRRMTTIIALLLGIACLWNSFILGPVMLFIGFVMIRLLGQGSMTLLPNTLVPQWFLRYRGRAMSFMTVGALLSAAALPPLNYWMIQNWGWPVAWRVWAVLLQVSSMFSILLFAFMWGVFEGFLMISLGVVWPNYFGREHLGSIRSIATTVTVVGSALGPLPFGVAYDWLGGYTEVLIFMMLFPFLAMIAAFISPPPVKN